MGCTRTENSHGAHKKRFSNVCKPILIPKWQNHRNPYSEVAQSSHHRNYSIYIHNPLYTFTILVNVSRVINYVIDYTNPPNTDTNLPPRPRTLQKPPNDNFKQKRHHENPPEAPN